jgi:hypothetical protein
VDRSNSAATGARSLDARRGGVRLGAGRPRADTERAKVEATAANSPILPAVLVGDLAADRAELERALLAELGEATPGLRQLARDAAAGWAAAEWYTRQAEHWAKEGSKGKAEEGLRLAGQYAERARETWRSCLDVVRESAQREARAAQPGSTALPDPLAWLDGADDD